MIVTNKTDIPRPTTAPPVVNKEEVVIGTATAINEETARDKIGDRITAEAEVTAQVAAEVAAKARPKIVITNADRTTTEDAVAEGTAEAEAQNTNATEPSERTVNTAMTLPPSGRHARDKTTR